MKMLKPLMKEKNLKMKELGEKIGVAEGTISLYASGKRFPSPKVDVQAIKKKMDKLTDLYMNDLIDRQKYEREYRDLQNRVKQQEAVRKPVDVQGLNSLLDAYKSLSKAAQRVFWNTVLERIEVDAEGEISFTLRIISSPREWFGGTQ